MHVLGYRLNSAFFWRLFAIWLSHDISSSSLVGFIHSLVYEYAVLQLLGIRGVFLLLECAIGRVVESPSFP